MKFSQPLSFHPNIRSEKLDATSGYIWGKPAAASNILQQLTAEEKQALSYSKADIIAERWIVTDDRQFPSLVKAQETPAFSATTPFFELLEQFSEELLGPQQVAEFGPYLNVIMKQLDTHSEPTRGSLSVQLHPKVGHPTRPAKPEMWKGTGKTYLGWKRDMTADIIKDAVRDSTLEHYMHAIEMTPEDLIVVSGGLIHAIRYDTFTAEWSKAPGMDDIVKGNVKDATVSPYDRTDGKTPRPGKENVEATLEVMEHAGTFGKSLVAELITHKRIIDQDKSGNRRWQLFRTAEVFVDEYEINHEYQLDLTVRGLPVYCEDGQAEIVHEGHVVDVIQRGAERYLPYSMSSVIVRPTSAHPIVFQTWYSPLSRERAAIQY